MLAMRVQDDRTRDIHTGQPLQPLEPERTRRSIAWLAALLLIPALLVGIWLASRAGSDPESEATGALPERVRPGEIAPGSRYYAERPHEKSI
jgi:hypothetical protein